MFKKFNGETLLALRINERLKIAKCIKLIKYDILKALLNILFLTNILVYLLAQHVYRFSINLVIECIIAIYKIILEL
jgi:hypothetical protein